MLTTVTTSLSASKKQTKPLGKLLLYYFYIPVNVLRNGLFIIHKI